MKTNLARIAQKIREDPNKNQFSINDMIRATVTVDNE